MRHLLSEGAAELERFARAQVLVALDYDGTLAPIRRDRHAATPRASTVELLRRVGQLYDCAVLSGRAQDDIAWRLSGIDLACAVGNHGLEPWDGTPALATEVGRWRDTLTTTLAACGGVEIEDKRYSLAIHFRAAHDKPAARLAIDRAVAALGPSRALDGKEVLNLLPAGAPDKGSALERLRADLDREMAIYVGDDETDEDVFALEAPWLLGIRVGDTPSSHARWFLRDQREVDALLASLCEIAVQHPLENRRRSQPSSTH